MNGLPGKKLNVPINNNNYYTLSHTHTLNSAPKIGYISGVQMRLSRIFQRIFVLYLRCSKMEMICRMVASYLCCRWRNMEKQFSILCVVSSDQWVGSGINALEHSSLFKNLKRTCSWLPLISLIIFYTFPLYFRSSLIKWHIWIYTYQSARRTHTHSHSPL